MPPDQPRHIPYNGARGPAHEDAMAHLMTARDIACPRCGVIAGQKCWRMTTYNGQLKLHHKERNAALEELVGYRFPFQPGKPKPVLQLDYQDIIEEGE